MKALVWLLVVCAALSMASCISGRVLDTEGIEEPAVAEGRYALVLFGGTSIQDIETVAVMDIEGDGYEVVPYAPEFRYRVISGQGALEALEKARHFLSLHPSFRNIHVREVEAPDGRTIAYEVRPLYIPLSFGESDVLDTTYLLDEGEAGGVRRVRLIVRLKPFVEKSDDFLREQREERR